jgi:hypothetical protein
MVEVERGDRAAVTATLALAARFVGKMRRQLTIAPVYYDPPSPESPRGSPVG